MYKYYILKYKIINKKIGIQKTKSNINMDRTGKLRGYHKD